MYTKGKWEIDGKHVVCVSVIGCVEISETICDISPLTEYQTVRDRNILEANENAILICKAPQMLEAIKEVLEILDGNGVANMEWIKRRLTESIY